MLKYCKTILPSHKETAVLNLEFTIGEILEDETSLFVSIKYADSPHQQADIATTNCMENMWWVKVIVQD